MPERRGFPNTGQVSAMAAATLLAECCITYGCLAHTVTGWIAAIAHGAVTLALAAWNRWSPAMRADLRLPLLLTASTAALGPLGPLGTLVTIALARWYARKAIPFEQWYRSLFPDTSQDSSAERLQRMAESEAEADSLSAFADVLAFGSFAQKQALISLISRDFRPAFGPVLKRALVDSQSAIRVQAATAMNKLENSIHARTLELTRQTREKPGDVDTLRKLARHYDDHLYSGLLDARREEEVRAKAIAIYQQCAAAEPADFESRLAVGRLLLRGGSQEEAAEWLGQSMQTGQRTPQAALWYMESLFRSGRFAELRRLSRSQQESYENPVDFPVDALDAVRLWAGEEPVPAGPGRG
jgi:polysaccharide biosynthesis protein PelE